MNYRETLEYLYSQLPMFQRVGEPAFRKSLDNSIYFDNLTGNPHRNYPCIHIAGTNGKGSVTHMIAAVLQQAGYKTGIYSSPHLRDFRERIKVNGEMMEEEFVIGFVEKYKAEFDKITPSFFEITVAMAFDYFASRQVDVAVVETGMGGRFDSTNIITPELSIITNISLEHQQFLGDTLSKIAFEKAGIIKPGKPVIIGESQDECNIVYQAKCSETNSPIIFADKEYSITSTLSSIEDMDVSIYSKMSTTKLKVGTGAKYQLKNIITAFASVVHLMESGWEISMNQIIKGFHHFKTITNFQGRWDILQTNPLVIADCAHNPAGLQLVLEQVAVIQATKKHFIIGMVKDKDISASISIFPKEGQYYFCTPDIPRGLDATILSEMAGEAGLQGIKYHSVAEAYNAARQAANKDDLIFIGGSAFVVAEII